MATGRKSRGGAPPRRTAGSQGGEAGRVVRRPKEERRGLPPDLEAFARSDERRLRRAGPKGPKLKDPRPVALVPGVSNRDARAVCDARVERLRALLAAGEDGPLSAALAEAVFLGLWRGRAFTGLGALTEDVLAFPLADADRLARAGASQVGLPCETLRPELVAAWFRAEAALLEEGHEAAVRAARSPAGEPVLEVAVSGARAADAFHAIGRRMTPLVRDHQPEGAPPPRRHDRPRDRGPER